MGILCTFPGRHGDLLWALPTIRAISEKFGEPVDLQIAGEFKGLLPILEAQPYIKRAWADGRWSLTPPEEWQAPTPFSEPDYDTVIAGWDHIIHCGYRGWPTVQLPFWTWMGVNMAYGLDLPELDLRRPWIGPTAVPPPPSTQVVCAFSDEWVEMKAGTILAGEMEDCLASLLVTYPTGSRWQSWSGYDRLGLEFLDMGWAQLAEVIGDADLFVGCCSAPHVLAAAMGKPVVVYEPSQARLNPIFWPLGTDGPIHLVKNGVGEPTIDARDCAKTIRSVLHA